jgi:hypothetical protein
MGDADKFVEARDGSVAPITRAEVYRLLAEARAKHVAIEQIEAWATTNNVLAPKIVMGALMERAAPSLAFGGAAVAISSETSRKARKACA